MSSNNDALKIIQKHVDQNDWTIDSVNIEKETVSRTDPDNPQFIQHELSGSIIVTLKITDAEQTEKAKRFLNGEPL